MESRENPARITCASMQPLSSPQHGKTTWHSTSLLDLTHAPLPLCFRPDEEEWIRWTGKCHVVRNWKIIVCSRPVVFSKVSDSARMHPHWLRRSDNNNQTQRPWLDASIRGRMQSIDLFPFWICHIFFETTRPFCGLLFQPNFKRNQIKSNQKIQLNQWGRLDSGTKKLVLIRSVNSIRKRRRAVANPPIWQMPSTPPTDRKSVSRPLSLSFFYL